MSSSLKALVLVSAMAVLFEAAIGATIVVGAPKGQWDLTTDYEKWAATQKVKVGDKLVFKYDLIHEVLLVTKASYDKCDTSNPIKKYTGGNTIVPLGLPGTKYFTCGIPGHCAVGMKLSINVAA